MENYANSDVNPTFMAALMAAMFIPFIIIYVITVIGMWKTFEKAGKPGWTAIIPIYNYIVMLEIVGKPIWWIFLILIPCTSLIFTIWTINLFSKSFGNGVGFTIGLVFLPFIFFPVLGFGSSKYIGPAGAGPLPFSANDFQDPFNTPNPPQV